MDPIAGSFDPRVLIVEADRQTREAMLVYFRIFGCSVCAVGNNAEAQAAIHAQPFDLIIADYSLPDCDGVSVLLSSIARQKRAIRILTTAYSSDGSPIPGDLTGIDEVILKPFTGDELRDRIECRSRERCVRIDEPFGGPNGVPAAS